MNLPRYSAYKPSGVQWLGSIPEHWGVNRLKFLLKESLMYGANESAEYDNPDWPRYIRITDLDNANGLREETFKSLPEDVAEPYLLQDKDLLLARSGATVGKSFLYREDWGKAAYAGYLIRARFKKNLVVPDFVAYFFRSTNYWDWLNSVFIQATIQNVSAEKYANIVLPLPSREEQIVIVAFLDRETARIDTLIEKKRRFIELLQEKRSALISHAVTRGLNPDAPLKDSGIKWLGQIPAHWAVTKLKYATSKIVDCPHETPIYNPDGGYCVIRTADITPGILDLSNARRVDDDEYKKRIRREPVLEGDIVYGREGERWGLAAIVPRECNVCLGQRMMQFRTPAGVNSTYLMWLLNSHIVYQQGVIDTAGSTSPHVNVDTIRNYWLIKPPLSEQLEIGRFVDIETTRLDSFRIKVETAIDKLKECRAALITAAVTGKIDVREAA